MNKEEMMVAELKQTIKESAEKLQQIKGYL